MAVERQYGRSEMKSPRLLRTDDESLQALSLDVDVAA